MKRLRVGLSILGLGLFACGGRALVDNPGSAGTGTTAPAATSTAKGKPGNPSDPLPGKDLGECTPGFDRAQNPEQPCRWITESGMCFDKSDAACACICPTQGQSVCAHGFDRGPDGAVLVVCD
ncbi:MAG TPA: hypothetical protein VFK05_39035 [Polyangiaceae bacterium]|nr:hypothetical protein [Polyangiaceae bacterium]